MLDIFQYSFMIRALVAGVLISLIAPLIGSFLVVKRYSLIADTLSHVALTGVALGLLLNIYPLATTVLITVIAAIAIELLRRSQQLPAEAILAMFLPGGFALSLILLSLANGFNTNLFSYLFGSITTVSLPDLYLIAPLTLITFGLTIFFYRQLFFTAFDEESARVRGLNVNFFNLLLIILTAITVSLSMRIVGILLIGALMVIPVNTATRFAGSFRATIILALLFALLSVIAGLFLSFYAAFPAGATIVLVSLFFFLFASLFKRR